MSKLFFSFLLITSLVTSVSAQSPIDITRIEFNSGTRGYREQIITTPDSIIFLQEDSKVNPKPIVTSRKSSPKEWSKLLECLKDVRLTEIETLESPTMKRAYDGASHSSIIITTTDNNTFSHGFDDEDPHKKLKPLMTQIKKYRKK